MVHDMIHTDTFYINIISYPESNLQSPGSGLVIAYSLLSLLFPQKQSVSKAVSSSMW